MPAGAHGQLGPQRHRPAQAGPALVEEARDVGEQREDIGRDGAQVVRVPHEQVEDGVDRGAAGRLRVELPAGMIALEKKCGAQVGKEGAAVGPVVAFPRRECFDRRQRFFEQADAAAVRGRVVGTEPAAVGAQTEFRGVLRGQFPRGTEELLRGSVQLRGTAARGRTENSRHGAGGGGASLFSRSGPLGRRGRT